MLLNHQYRSIEERLTGKRLVWGDKGPDTPADPKQEVGKIDATKIADDKKEAEAKAIVERMEGSADKAKGKVKIIIDQLAELDKKVSGLGSDVKSKFNDFLKAKFGTLKIETSPDSKGAQDAFSKAIEKLQKDKNNEALRELDRGLDVVLLRVDFRKEMVKTLDATGLVPAEKTRIGTALESQLAKRELAVEGTITRESFKDIVETFYEMCKCAKMLDKTKAATTLDKAISITDIGIAYPNAAGGPTAYFNYWQEGGNIYSIDNVVGRVQVYDPNGAGSGKLAWRFLDTDKQAGDPVFSDAQRNAAKGNANKSPPSADELAQMIKNQLYERSFISGDKRNYRDFPGLQSDMAAKFDKQFDEFAAKHAEGYSKTGAEGSGGSFAMPLGEMFKFFADRMGDTSSRNDFTKESFDKVKDAQKKKETKEVAKAPSEKRTEAPDRTKELLREGYSSELKWGEFTVKKADTPQTLTRVADKQPGIKSRKVVETRLDDRPINRNFKIDDSKHALLVDPDTDGNTGTTNDQFDQALLEGSYSVLIENTGDDGKKTYEKMTVVIQPKSAPEAGEIKFENSDHKVSSLKPSAAPNATTMAELSPPRPGYKYQLKAGETKVFGDKAGKLTPTNQPINIQVVGNTLGYVDHGANPPAGMNNALTVLKPGNVVSVVVELLDSSNKPTGVEKKVDMKVDYPADPTEKDISVMDVPEEGGEGKYVLRQGKLSANNTLVNFNTPNSEVEWKATGTPGGWPADKYTDWLNDFHKVNGISVKKDIEPDTVTGQRLISLTLTGTIPGKPNSKPITKNITIDVQDFLKTAEQKDIELTDITNGALPESLAGATVTQGNTIDLAHFNDKRSGIDSIDVDEAFVVKNGVKKRIDLKVDTTDKILQLYHSTDPTWTNELTPGATLEINMKGENLDMDAIKMPSLKIIIPEYSPPAATDAQLVDGGETIRVGKIQANGVITRLKPLAPGRDRAVTRAVKDGKAKIGNTEYQVEIAGDEVKLKAGQPDINITSPGQRLQWTTLVGKVGAAPGSEVPVDHSVDLEMIEPATLEDTQIVVGGKLENTDTLYLGDIGGADKPPEFIAELKPTPEGITKKLGTVAKLNNIALSAADLAKIHVDDKSNRVWVDPSLTLNSKDKGSVLSFSIDAISASGQTVNGREITLNIKRREEKGKESRADASSPEIREQDNVWFSNLETSKKLAGVDQAFIMPNGVDASNATNRWEVISNGGSTAVVRGGTPNAPTFKIEATGSVSVEVPTSDLDKILYMALQINRLLEGQEKLTFTQDAIDNKTYYKSGSWSDIVANDTGISHTTAINSFPYTDKTAAFIQLLNSKTEQYLNQKPATRGILTRDPDGARWADPGKQKVVDEDDIRFNLITNSIGILSPVGQSAGYDYFISYQSPSGVEGVVWKPLTSADHVEIKKADLKVETDKADKNLQKAKVYILRVPKSTVNPPSNPVMQPIELQLAPKYLAVAMQGSKNGVTLLHATNPAKNIGYLIEPKVIGNKNPAVGRNYEIEKSGDDLKLVLIDTSAKSRVNLGTLTKDPAKDELIFTADNQELTKANLSVTIPALAANTLAGSIEITLK
jgi:hypothetical protein